MPPTAAEGVICHTPTLRLPEVLVPSELISTAVSVTEPIVSPFCRPLLVKAVVPRLSLAYVLVWSDAVMVRPRA